MHIADLLSRNYINNEFDKEINIEGVIHSINNIINVSKIAEATKHDLVLVNILEYYNIGWPKNKNKVSGERLNISGVFVMISLLKKEFFMLKTRLLCLTASDG
jgi:hypothetical protein